MFLIKKKIQFVKKAGKLLLLIHSVFSKIFKRFLHNQINAHFENILFHFLSASRKHFSTQHVLPRLIEDWKLHLDNNKVVGAILMVISKAFDSLLHQLITVKLAAYGPGKGALRVIFSYLKNRKQSVKVKVIQSLPELILSGVTQGSLLGPILFNIFIKVHTALLQNFFQLGFQFLVFISYSKSNLVPYFDYTSRILYI